MKITGLDHLALACRDLEVAEDFYTRVLGGRVVRRIGGTESDLKAGRVPQAIVQLAEGVRINLNGGQPEVPEGHFIHWAFHGEAAEIDDWVATFQTEGIQWYGPYGHGGVGHVSLYFHDPTGYLLELSMDFGDWETAKTEVKKRGGQFGSTLSTYDPDEWDRTHGQMAGT
jgi:catechol 2,3-dioxygenase-like lactoylglutathione lyase family enzyme